MKVNQLIVGTLFFLLMSCGNDGVATKQKNLLIGHWDLAEGQRNGKVTESLRGTYFEFTEEGKMSTNLPIKGGIDSPYVIADGVITQTIINGIEINYNIVELNEQTLKLTTTLRGFDFVFDLAKEEKEENLSMN